MAVVAFRAQAEVVGEEDPHLEVGEAVEGQHLEVAEVGVEVVLPSLEVVVEEGEHPENPKKKREHFFY